MGNQQGPTVQHRELCSVLRGSLNGREVWGRMDTCICMAESLCCPSETITTFLICYVCAYVLSCFRHDWTESCLTLCNPMDWSLPGSSVHGILQVRILKWVTMPSSGGSSHPQDWSQFPHCRWVLYWLRLQGCPRILEWVAYPFSRGLSQPRN